MSEMQNELRSMRGIYFVRHRRSCKEQFEIIFSSASYLYRIWWTFVSRLL